MARALVIVESPAKAKTINKYLGKDFIVKSSIGHVRDLPVSGGAKEDKEPAVRGKAKEAAPTRAEKARSALIARMGVDPDHDWEAHYQILPGKEKVIAELKSLAAGVETVYLATDLDREGEAIAWHLREVIGGSPDRYQRVVFNEITKSAITAAFQSPSALNMDRVNAQQARRFLDRVVGYMVSPLLWERLPAACLPDACNPWRCAWWWKRAGNPRLCLRGVLGGPRQHADSGPGKTAAASGPLQGSGVPPA